MASKMPYMQFYVNDFDNDTKGISSLAVGVWIRVLINMHKDSVGSITGTLDKLAKMTRCTVEELQTAIPELVANDVAEIANADAKKTLESQDCHTLSHAVVTLTCRRMKRDEEKRKLASLRKQKERMSRDDSEYCHADVTQKDNSLSRGNHAIRAPKESESESESERERTLACSKENAQQTHSLNRPANIAQVIEEAAKRSCKIGNDEAQRFIDKNDATADQGLWMINKTPVTDWRKILATWVPNWKKDGWERSATPKQAKREAGL